MPISIIKLNKDENHSQTTNSVINKLKRYFQTDVNSQIKIEYCNYYNTSIPDIEKNHIYVKNI